MTIQSETTVFPPRVPADAPATSQPLILLEGLGHTYPKTSQPALSDIDLAIDAGHSLALLGPNGSGKSTLFRILATMLKPTIGRACLAGFDCVTQPMQVRRYLGVVFQSPSLDETLSLTENLICHARILGLAGSAARERTQQLLAQFNLSDRASDKVASLSGGLARRVDLARALLTSPRVLLLDEPTTGLDPAARREFWQVVEQCQREQGMTIIAATHLTDEADRFDQVALLDQGKMLAKDQPDVLKQAVGSEVIEIELGEVEMASRAALKEEVAALPGIAKVNERDTGWLIEVDDGPARVAAVASTVRDAAVRISLGKPTLEDVYLHHTGKRLVD